MPWSDRLQELKNASSLSKDIDAQRLRRTGFLSKNLTFLADADGVGAPAPFRSYGVTVWLEPTVFFNIEVGTRATCDLIGVCGFWT